MTDSLKHKTGSALFWNFIDKAGQQVIQLLFLFILYRVLVPEEFGLIALLAIFMAIANLLQESGFSSALIRNPDADNKDYSTVFYFNVVVSVVIYLFLFFFAPVIASFYEKPALTDLARVIFLSFVFNAFGIIQNVHLMKRMDFRTNTRITFLAGLLSGAVAVWMAYSGYGVWSLVIQQVLQAFLRTVFLWLFVRWYPSVPFVYEKLKQMLPYSSKLLAMGVMNQMTAYLYPLVIGKFFSVTQVGYYDQARKWTYVPQTIISSSIYGVAYPLLTKIDDSERVKRAFRKIIRIGAFISFPVSALLVIAAKPIVEIIMSREWLEVIPMLQILAVGASVYPLHTLISALLQSLGRSGLLFRIEFLKNSLTILSILLLFRFGILAMICGLSAINILMFITGYFLSGKYIGYRIIEILKDILPYFCISLLVFIPVYFINELVDNPFLLFSIQSVVGLGLYLVVVKVLGSKVLDDAIEFVSSKRSSKKQ